MASPSIQSIVDRILQNAPTLDRAKTVDTFKSGNPNQPVTAIAVTFMATRTVLQRAVELGANLVITHEPTFYDGQDDLAAMGDDPVCQSKRAFLDQHGLTVWRCHDAIHQFKPDGIFTGMVARLGWAPFQDAAHANVFHLPRTTLGGLAAELKQKLGIGSLRVTGALDLPCAGVALSPGCCGWPTQRKHLNRPGVDVLVCGEQREWETCEYVRDTAAAGQPKGLIVLGHANSEEAGMAWFADWLRERLAGVAVHFVPAGDPFAHV